LQNNFSSYGENKEDYSDLPPNQRKKKLQLRVEDITAKIQQETAARYIVWYTYNEFPWERREILDVITQVF
jgi:predicted LPLAT superfamily acyltransferase